MSEDRGWERIVDAIESKYGLSAHGRNTQPVADAMNLTEQVAWITFERDGQTYKVERVVGPAIVDRRTIGARKAGSEVRYENVYDPEEASTRTNLYRQIGDDWQLLDLDQLSL